MAYLMYDNDIATAAWNEMQAAANQIGQDLQNLADLVTEVGTFIGEAIQDFLNSINGVLEKAASGLSWMKATWETLSDALTGRVTADDTLQKHHDEWMAKYHRGGFWVFIQ